MRFRARGLFGFALAVASFMLHLCDGKMCGVAWGQLNRITETQTRAAQFKAIGGEPFGVFVAEIPLPPSLRSLAGGQRSRVLVGDRDGRIFYPAVSFQTAEVAEEIAEPPRVLGRPGGLIDRVRSAIRSAPKMQEFVVGVKVTALYRGQGPITMQLSGDLDQELRIEPSPNDAQQYDQLLQQWWQAYTENARRDVSEHEFPTLVQKYLVSMLAQRMGLPRVDLNPPKADEDRDAELSQPLETLSLLAAIEPLREEILESVLHDANDSTAAELPVPSPPAWTPNSLPALDRIPDGPVLVEELAEHVPPECFYLRFGSFANYVWFQDITERFGGDLAQAVLLRGFNYEASVRMERMLATKMTQIAKMFGDQLIGDMAVIGSDLYMKEGASLGVVFYAKNATLLAAAIQSDRQSVAKKTPGATISELDIGGRKVSLLSTPDNSVRSLMVVDGAYVFITTSRTLMERFIEVGVGGPSLADTSYFRWARYWMPDSNDYSVFACFSPEFFHRLVSPQYQIELRRRLEAIAHLEIAELASQVAQSEGLISDDLIAMQAAGLVPSQFDFRPDGAQTLRSGDRWIDSLRGRRGSFLPIADVPLHAVTQAELETYNDIAEFYQNKWKRMDPMLFGLRRFQSENGKNRERVVLEAYLAPFEPEKYGWLARQLGAPSAIEIQQPADDVASLQVHVRGDSIIGPNSDDYYLFAGVKDMIPPDPEDTQGLIRTLLALKSAPAYIGAWPKPDLVQQLPLGLGRSLASPDYAGYSRMLGGIWRWQDESFSLLSFDRSILENAVGQLAAVESQDAAQARLHVANLEGSELSAWVNRNWYERGWKSSQGNAHLLDGVHQQLKVPARESMEVAQRLLDVRLQCPLGGKYEFATANALKGASENRENGRWISTAWQLAVVNEAGELQPPTDYEAPWMEWFRGARFHLTQGEKSLSLVGDLELEMQPLSIDLDSDQSVTLPPMNFDLFSLPMKFLGVEKKAEEPQRRGF